MVPVDQAICSYCHLIPGFSVAILIKRVDIQFLICSSKDQSLFAPTKFKSKSVTEFSGYRIVHVIFLFPPTAPLFPQGSL